MLLPFKIDSRGLSLPELMVGISITLAVSFGGIKAYEYFLKETKKETARLDDIAEFNLLTRDFLKFAEGAGISTAYLNAPIQTQGCPETLPCVRKLQDAKFIPATSSDLPQEFLGSECTQFFKDAKGALEAKSAFPGKDFSDLLIFLKISHLINSPLSFMPPGY